MYKDVETSILRGYMVAQLAYMILGLREFGKANNAYKTHGEIFRPLRFHVSGKFRNESQELHLKVTDHNHNLRSSIKEVIPLASRDVFSCSPDNYVFGMSKLVLNLIVLVVEKE